MVTFEELLAVLLSHGGAGRGVMEISRDLANLSGNESGLFELDGERIISIPGIGRARASVILAAAELSRRKSAGKLRSSSGGFSPEATARWLLEKLRGRGKEFFYLLTFTRNYRLIQAHLMDKGDSSGTEVSVRDLYGTLIADRAYLALIAHNHPDGSAKPSQQDLDALLQAEHLLETIDVYLIDQYITGADGVFSCRQDRFISI